MAQNEVQVKVTSEISNAKTYEKDMASIAKKRLDEINELKRAEKISAEQLADLKQRLNSETFDKEKQAAMRLHKLRVDNAKKESLLNKDLLGGVKETKAGNVASSVGGALGNAIPGIGMMANPITMASAALTGTIATGAAVGKSSIQQYASYEQARNKTQTLAGSSFNKEALDKKTMEVASATKFNQTDVANAVNVLIQGGKSFDEAMAMVGTVANTDLAHGKTIEESAGLLIATSNQFGLKAEDVGKAADIFTKATTVTALDFQAIQDGMKNAGPALSSLGQGVALTTAQLGALANIGISGSEAGTALKSMVAMTTSQQGQNTLSSYGVSLTNEDGSMRAINEIFAEFKTALDATGKNDAEKLAEWKKVAGEFTGQAQALADSNETIKELTVNLEASANATTELAQTQQQGINGLLDQITSNWEIVKNMIGEYLAPLASGVLEGIRDGIVSAFSWLSEVFKVIQQMFAPFIDSVKGSTSTISSVLTGAIGAAIIATMTLVTTISVLLDFASKLLQTLCNGIVAIQDTVLEVLRKMPFGDEIADKIEKISPVSIIKDVGTLVEESKKGNDLDKQLADARKKQDEEKPVETPEFDPKKAYEEQQRKNEQAELEQNNVQQESGIKEMAEETAKGVGEEIEDTKKEDEKKKLDDEYTSFLTKNGLSQDAISSYLNGQFDVANKFSGTTASMSSYAQFDWESSGADEKQLDQLKKILKSIDKIKDFEDRREAIKTTTL